MKSYTEYKESGIDWIGKIPKNWEIRTVKRAFFRKKAEAQQENPVVLSLARSGIRVRDISNNEGQLAENYSNYNPVEPGDFILNPMDLYSGANCNVSKIYGVISPAYINLKAKSGYSSSFYDYYFKTQYWAMALFAHGTGVSFDNRWTLNNNTLMNYKVPYTSFPEQQAIADFLDRKTAQIDTLIEKKQRQIDLLQEQRTALINHAVTKGLNPDVHMKDSGVEWLGEIPSHWTVKPLKHIKAQEENAFVDGPFGSNLKTIHFVDNGDVFVIESGFVTTGQFVPGKYKTITREHFETIKRSECKAGDIIIAKIGARFGTSGILPELGKPCVVSGNSLKLTVNIQENSVEFIHNELLSLKRVGAAFELIVNATAQPALSLGRMNEMLLAVPLKSEQEEIVKYIRNISQKIDEAEDRIHRHISLLQEYRTALISEAVTGKIDVR